MDLNKLRLLIDVYRYGSFEKAAESNYLSQRGVSKQMHQLKRELGFRLFTITSNKISFTESGRFFVHKSQQLLELSNTNIEEGRQIASENAVSFKTAFFSPFETSLLMAKIKGFKKQNPNLRVYYQVMEGPVEQILWQLKNKDLDLAIIPDFGNDDHFKSDFLNTRVAHDGPMVAAVSQNSPLAKKKFLEGKDLLHQNIVYYSDYATDYLLQKFIKKIEPTLTARPVESFEELRLSVALNIGMTFIPQGQTEPFVNGNELVVLRRINPIIPNRCQIRWVFRKRDNDPYLRNFIHLLQ